MEFSKEVDKLLPAIIKARSEFSKIIKDKKNDFTKKNYADLAGYIDPVEGPLTNNGLMAFQTPYISYHVEKNPSWSENWEPKTDKEKQGYQPPPEIYVARITVSTMIVHESGQYVKAKDFTLLTREADPQGIGKVVTYARRYSIAPVLFLAAEDDDGNSAKTQNNNTYGSKTALPPLPPKQNQPSNDFQKNQNLKLRRGVNPILLKEKSLQGLEKVILNFNKTNPDKLKQKTFHNNFETFESLFNQHRERCRKLNPTYSQEPTKEKKDQFDFDNCVEECSTEEDFKMVEESLLEKEHLQTEENQNTINKLGRKLGIEGY